MLSPGNKDGVRMSRPSQLEKAFGTDSEVLLSGSLSDNIVIPCQKMSLWMFFGRH